MEGGIPVGSFGILEFEMVQSGAYVSQYLTHIEAAFTVCFISQIQLMTWGTSFKKTKLILKKVGLNFKIRIFGGKISNI